MGNTSHKVHPESSSDGNISTKRVLSSKVVPVLIQLDIQPNEKRKQSYYFLVGESSFVVHESFIKPIWIRTESLVSVDRLILQAAYADRFDCVNPSLSVKSKFLTFRFNAGKYLSRNCTAPEPPGNHDSHLSSPHQRVDESVAGQSQLGRNLFSAWPMDLRKFQDKFHINEDKFCHILASVKESYSLRVFLSSPFDGCELERQHFMESWFPGLFSKCQAKGIFLSVVDMRWGITDRLSAENKTIRACLDGIDSTNIFLGYFGARYGSSQLGSSQPNKWIDSAIDNCLHLYPFLGQLRDRSVTELEWQHAALFEANAKDPSKPLSFFLYRSLVYDGKMAIKCPKSFLIENEESKVAAATLRQTVVDLAQQELCSTFEDYPSPEMGAKLMFHCCDAVVSRIIDALEADETATKLTEHRRAHSSFMRAKLATYVELNDNLVQNIFQLLTSSPENRESNSIIVVHGESGAGKSCFMARVVNELVMMKELVVLYHFVGCDDSTADLGNMLSALLDDFLNMLDKHTAATIMQRAKQTLEIDDVLRLICDICASLRHLPFVIVIDAVNQLHPMYSSMAGDIEFRTDELRWLSADIPPNVRLLLSCAPSATLDNLSTSIWRPCFVSLPAIGQEQRQALIKAWLAKYFKGLDRNISDGLCSHPCAGSPLFLIFCLNYLLLHGSYNTLAAETHRLLAAQSVDELVIIIIQSTEQSLVNSGCSFSTIVKFVLSFIYCSREGLSSDELFQLLSNESEARVDTQNWIFVQYALRPLLLERKGLLTFNHDSVHTAVQNLYFASAASSSSPIIKDRSWDVEIHRKLSVLFRMRADAAADDVRALAEMEYHQEKCFMRPCVSVCLRVRPLSPMEGGSERLSNSSNSSLSIKGRNVLLFHPKHKNPYSFAYNVVCDDRFCTTPNHHKEAQERVYRHCGSDLMKQVLGGNNVCLLAYGQTGSGKSHSLFGNRACPGLVYLTMEALLKKLSDWSRCCAWKWHIHCTMTEIYLGKVFDLLNHRKEVTDIRCKCESDEVLQKNADDFKFVARAVEMPDIQRSRIQNVSDLERIIRAGYDTRITKETAMNSTSSRSHCIISFQLWQHNAEEALILQSVINFVDLAGNERASAVGGDPVRDKERIFINKSLSVLNQCIMALSDPGARFVPYRNSMLTWLLQESLGGNSKVVLLATANPDVRYYSETLSTLQYASLSKKMVNTKDNIFLLAEAAKVRSEELRMKSLLCDLFGYPVDHLDLCSEFEAKRAVSNMASSLPTWARELYFVKEIKEFYASGTNPEAHYICCFHAYCTDASHQRHLRCLPNEQFRIYVVASSVNCNAIGNCVEIVLAGDSCADGVVIGSVHVNNNRTESVLQAIEMKSPAGCGLYQLRSRVNLANRSSSSKAGNGSSSTFIAWLTVVEMLEPKGPGPMAKIDFNSILGIDVDPMDVLNGAWEGTWTKLNTRWSYHLTLYLEVDRSGGTVSGCMVWNVTEHDSDVFRNRNFVGLCAIEHISGTFSTNDFVLRFDGTRKDDPTNIIAVDKYELNLNALAKQLIGKTATNDSSWSGRMTLKKQSDNNVRYLSGNWTGTWLEESVQYLAQCCLNTSVNMEAVGTVKLFHVQEGGDGIGRLHKELVLSGRYDMSQSSFLLHVGSQQAVVQLYYGLNGPTMKTSDTAVALTKV